MALVPAFVFSAILLQRNNEAQEQVVEALVGGTTSSIVQAVEREIIANITTLRVLASAPALIAGDYRSFHTRVRLALAATDTFIYLLDADLNGIMSTRVEYGAPVPASNDLEAPREALETGDIVVSSVVFGALSRQWVVNILLPLFFDGQAPMVMGLSRNADGLSAILLANKLPAGWSAALVDARGTVISASAGAAAGEPFFMNDLAAVSSASGWVEVEHDGTAYFATAQRSGLTGWTLVAWAPHELITQPLATAFWSLLVGGVLLAAVVVLVIYLVSLQIGRSVHGLEDDAQLLGAGEAVPIRDYPVSEIATVSEALADASQRRRSAENEVRLLMRELAHRSKNQLTVIAAMAKQSAKSATSVADFVTSFEKRIHSLARSTDLLLAHGIAGVDLGDILARQVDPLCPLDSGRVTLSGPPLKLNTQAAQILGMAAHEMATNAVKYGAFSVESGQLDIRWTIGEEMLELLWRETGASVEKRSRRRGFGTTVLENMVGLALAAKITRNLKEDGIEWRFEIPVEGLRVEREARDPSADAGGKQAVEPDSPPPPNN